MPEVSFTIANRSYSVRCADGQEANLRAVAADLSARVADLAARTGSTDERQLLVVAALEMLDALREAEAAKADLEALRAWAGGLADRLDALGSVLDELVPGSKQA